jgi:hypothetical protein
MRSFYHCSSLYLDLEWHWSLETSWYYEELYSLDKIPSYLFL